MKNKGLNRASTLMEEVKDLLNSIEPNERLEAMEAFAQMALIAENLALGLDALAESYDEPQLSEVAGSYVELAREAAEVALTLESATDDAVNHKALKEAFEEQASHMIDGLSLFAELTEAEDEDEKDDKKDDKPSKKDDEDEDEDEEEDEKEESVNWSAIARTLAEKADLIASKLKGSVDATEVTDGDAKPAHPALGPDLRKVKTKGKVDIVK